MSLFEDLVEELKEDNLLEETVIDSVQKTESQTVFENPKIDVENKIIEDSRTQNLFNQPFQTKIVDESNKFKQEMVSHNESTIVQKSVKTALFNDINVEEDNKLPQNLEFETSLRGDEKINQENSHTEIIATSEIVDVQEKEIAENPTPVIKYVDEREFYRQRAIDEVNGLQMVEQVLVSVEREQMKTVSKTYDDLEVKQALHDFLQVSNDVKSPNHAQAEFRLMQETEDWYSALTRKDRNISVGHLRRYCETTKPSLSSQALISLARFYRNSPFSESVRGKFDLVITRLFTKEIDVNKRELLFKADELLQHIQDLYAEWSSVPLYSIDDDDSELLLAALKFQDFVNEAEHAESFDELIKTDFFKRLKVFKEQTNENFFSPLLVFNAIECNVAIGNRYVELLELEKEKSNVSNLTNKYGIVHDKSISEATSKTLELLEILNQRKPEPEVSVQESQPVEDNIIELPTASKTNVKKIKKQSLFKANKWLILATAFTIIFAAVFFMMGGHKSLDNGLTTSSSGVKVVNLDNSSLKEYVDSAKINRNTLYAITNDNWKKMNLTDKKEIVTKFISVGKDKEFEKVHLINSEGKTVAFGSKDTINVVE